VSYPPPHFAAIQPDMALYMPYGRETRVRMISVMLLKDTGRLEIDVAPPKYRLIYAYH
jgi:hypothetical protein